MMKKVYPKEHYIRQMHYICRCIKNNVAYGIKEIIVDNFAGGGGASTGIEIATGYNVYAAINHDPDAIRMHMANHPNTKHYCESVWDVDPREVCDGNAVGLAWFSPDCKHFSKAKGGKPVDKNIRGLAWIVLKWAALVRPRVIMLENVEEFQTWGPCIPVRDKETGRVIVNMSGDHTRKKGEPLTRVAEKGEVVSVKKQIFYPDPDRKGETYRKWKHQLEDLGYVIETKELVAADYGAPTKRKRFFMIARCDGKSIVWPEPTHGPRNSAEVKAGLLKPYVAASEIIDWSLPCPSIFGRKKPLAENTMKRIAKGLQKFVIDNPEPFIVQVNHSGEQFRGQDIKDPMPTLTAKNGLGVVVPFIEKSYGGNYSGSGSSMEEPLHTITAVDHNHVVAPTLIQYHSEIAGGDVRGQTVREPVMTIDGSNRYGLVNTLMKAVYICQQQGQSIGTDIREPLNTMTGVNHMGEVDAFLTKYYGNGTGQDLNAPLESRDRFALVEIKGVKYRIVDIGLRMLTPRELYAAQGFPDDYIIDRDIEGGHITKTEQVKRCGNAVCPPIPAAMVKANLPELCKWERLPICRPDRLKQEDTGQLRFA